MCACCKQTESDDVTFYSKSTSVLAQRDMRGSSEDSNGDRENDALTRALQTKEQRGRVHGVCRKLTWKDGFVEHKSMYRKRKMTTTPLVDIEELNRQQRREVLGDLRSILEASGI
jgi:hypothetical protein